MHDYLHRLAPAVALCLPLLAFAQAQRADPADPRSPAPALRYSSAFADYKPWQNMQPGDWRAINDTVRDAAAKGAGAHAGHASPAPASTAAPAPAAKASAPAIKGHGGHHMPGSKP